MVMSVALVGAWESGFSYPLLEAEHWRYLVQGWGVSDWVMTPITGILAPHLREVTHLNEEVDSLAQTHRIVFVDEHGQSSLTEYEHPENACYVFGRVGFSPYTAWKDVYEHDSVVIPGELTPGLLWSHQAAAIILYDRELKRGGNGN